MCIFLVILRYWSFYKGINLLLFGLLLILTISHSFIKEKYIILFTMIKLWRYLIIYLSPIYWSA